MWHILSFISCNLSIFVIFCSLMLDIYDNYIYVIIYVHFLIGTVIKQKTWILCESENLMHIQKKALPKIQDGFICACDPESL